ncbi:MAG: hypothetical protein HGJ97_18555 [Desulfosporosinus sp.]|nr:hypothetical protein [Desulfosporosinus sp.]
MSVAETRFEEESAPAYSRSKDALKEKQLGFVIILVHFPSNFKFLCKNNVTVLIK